MIKKLYQKETFKTDDDWLDHRGIGGSSASAILGKNPWMSPLKLYLKCITPIEKQKKQSDSKDKNAAMKYGTECEPLIRKIFALDYPYYKVHEPKNHEMYRRIDKPYLTATVDSILIDLRNGDKGIQEIKTHDILSSADREFWESNNIPENYFIQIVHYLMVLNDFKFVVFTTKLRYYSYDGTTKTLVKTEIKNMRVERESIQKWIDFLEKKETYFWEENVLKHILPQPENISFNQ